MTTIGPALSGLRASESLFSSAATNAANVNTQGYKATRTDILEGFGRTPEAVSALTMTPGPLVESLGPAGESLFTEQSNVDLTNEVATMQVAKASYGADLKVVQAQDEMLGTLLDLVD